MTEVPKLYQDWNYEGETVAFEDWKAEPEKVLDAAQGKDIGIVLDDETTVYLIEKSRYIELSEKTDFPDWYHDLSQAPRPSRDEMLSPAWLRVLLPDDSTGAVLREPDGRETVMLREWWFWRIEHVGPNNGRTAALLSELSDEDWEGVEKACLKILNASDEDDTPKPGM